MSDSNEEKQLQQVLHSVVRRLRGLTIAVVLMALMLMVTAALVFGNLINYFAGDLLLVGGSCSGAALLGFGLGWFARRIV